MSLPRETILEALHESNTNHINEELLIMIRDEISKNPDLKLLSNFSKSLYLSNSSNLIIPILELYQIDYFLNHQNESMEFQDLIEFYKFTFCNLVNLILIDSKYDLKSKLFYKVSKNLIELNHDQINEYDNANQNNSQNQDSALPSTSNTTSTNDQKLVSVQDIPNEIYKSLAHSTIDLCNLKQSPSSIPNDIKLRIKQKNDFLKLKQLYEITGLNNFPITTIQSFLKLSNDSQKLINEIEMIFAGQNQINYEIINNNVLVLNSNIELRNVDDLVKEQIEIAKLNKSLKDILV
ncbi:uncharacterized protein KGF55_000511 [Candida pseudojiufengensis]|uniref:uncharacterized protein n=1 Tax=Candida pseudojiufengensis TaxID=497109 RepID=UPI00222565F6|nr:uncharacterized protein KGF55_000511 [Candida pseudojiufengensis]KAI5966202.1 hypothetical protein KGF55_000511 [Candida pseudojiufengensis]